MKKLMFAMAIAATVGFAQAADPELISKSTFDDLAVGQFSTANETDTTWTNNTDTEGEVDATVTAYDPADNDNPKYLQLDGVQNLAKNINTAIGDGLYIDTMVKFTASEDEPTPGNGDKLVVWLKEIAGEGDDPSTYKLMVTAGYVDTDKGALSSKPYETTANVIPDNWYHLRVKAIENVDKIEGTDGTPGFVVFIGDDVVTTTECPADTYEFFGETKYVTEGSYAIFPSMVGGLADNGTTITQLAFSGSGAIDTVGAFQGDFDPDASTDVIDPASGDVAVTVAADGEAAAVTAAKALVSVPADAKDAVTAAAYAEYFDYSAVAGEAGKYTVSITGVKDTVSAGVLGSAVERLTTDDQTVTTIAVPAGLYYSITPSTGLPISGTAVKGLSTGGTVAVGKPGTTAGFYEVKISATPIQ